MRLRNTVLAASLLGLLALLPTAAEAQHHHATADPAKDYDDPVGGDPDAPAGCTGVPAKVQITGGSLSFSPATVTVQTGQKVCWTWQTSMAHNVRADSGAFGSGDPATSGNFQVTYTSPGTYGYHCQVHGSPTAGMRGTVIVAPADGGGGSGPGALRLLAGDITVNEGDGTAVLTVERAGGSEGAAAVSYTTANGSARTNKDFSRTRGRLTWPDGDGTPRTISVPIKNDTAREPTESFKIKLSKASGAPLETSLATVTINDDDTPGCGAASLSAPAGLRAVGQSPHDVRLSWSDEPAAAHAVHVERRTPGGDWGEVAIVAAGLGSFVDGSLPAGASFDYRVRSASPDGLSAFSAVAAAATDGDAGPCRAEGGEVCLLDGRFAARLAWRGGDRGELRPARQARLGEGDASGVFTLAGSEPAALVAVGDSCAANDHYWVSFAPLVERELRVQVRDTLSGRTWVHLATEGVLDSVREEDALGVCP
jgi:plastocyanin